MEWRNGEREGGGMKEGKEREKLYLHPCLCSSVKSAIVVRMNHSSCCVTVVTRALTHTAAR